MSNFERNKKIAILIVDLVSRMYKLGDGVLVEFEPSSKFPNADVTAMTSKDYRIIFNIDRLAICPESEVYVTAFHEMRHIYQNCCIDLSDKFPDNFNEPKERIEKWKCEFENYYVSNIEDDEKYLNQDCEIDAIAFAYLMMKELYSTNVVIPSVIKEKVLERAKEIINKR